MRREQVERCLASQLTIKEWCERNGVPAATMYSWMSRFRKEDPGMFGGPSAGEWIEVSREPIAARTALAVSGGACPAGPVPADRQPAGAGAVVVRMGAADVVVPEGAAEAHVAAVLRAVASL